MDSGSGDGGGGSGDAGGGGSGDGGGGTGSGETNGTAEIVFPWTHSAATAQTITIRGTASDPEGVASVSVNGVVATIVASGSGSVQKPSAKGLAEDEVEWEAEIALEQGENALAVSVEDADGNVAEDVDTTTITYVEVPAGFKLDPDGTRLVGYSNTLTPTGYKPLLVEHNYATLEQRAFERKTANDSALACLRRFDNEFLYLSFFTGSWELRKFDLTTEQDTLVRNIQDTDLHPGRPGFRTTPHLFGLACDSAHTSAYLLANYTDEDGKGYGPTSAFALSRVLEVPLVETAPITPLSETNTSDNPRWIAQYMALSETDIVTMEDVNPGIRVLCRVGQQVAEHL